MSKMIYHYDRANGALLGSEEAFESPLEPGVYLIPAFATDVEPPEYVAQKFPVFKDGKWEFVADWRGAELFSTDTAEPTVINELGVCPQDIGATEMKPPKTGERQTLRFTAGSWELIPDWRGVPLFSKKDGKPVSVSDVGQTPNDIDATDQAIPSDVYSWTDAGWAIDPEKLFAKFARDKEQALVSIDLYHAETVQELVGNPTQVEKDTWALKLEAANAISTGGGVSAAGAAFLRAALLADENSKIEWASSVLKKSAAYAMVVGLAERLRDEAKAAIKAATSSEELEAGLADLRSKADKAIEAMRETQK